MTNSYPVARGPSGNVASVAAAPASGVAALPPPARPRPSLLILGSRGVPAAHGGFETFAERLAPYMVERGWNVTVYCQREARPGVAAHGEICFDDWQGVRRALVHVAGSGPRATIAFDWRCVLHARREPGVALMLGYNTACFLLLLWGQRRAVITNMDGVEWKRAKWSGPAKAWFMANELMACALSSRLVADHPQIETHLRKRLVGRKTVMIPYGADAVDAATPAPLQRFDVKPGGFVVSIARIEPENSLLQIIRAFSCRPRGYKLICVGALDPEGDSYHARIRDAASDEVLFVGAIYDKDVVASLRRYALAYIHGHTVGGTNPSLVEALGAGCAIVAHRNKYNCWTAGDEQFYFSTEVELDFILAKLAKRPEVVAAARRAAAQRHRGGFTWDGVLASYEDLCRRAARGARALAVLCVFAFASLSGRPAHAEYILGPGDRLKIEVSAAIVRDCVVGADGEIALPQLGVVEVAGLSLRDAVTRIQGAYRAKGVLENAEVLMEVTQYRPFYIGGDVARPGAYPYQPGLTARQAITLAGGFETSRFRFTDNPQLRAADLRSEYGSLIAERLKLALRRRSAQAELDGEAKVDFGDVAFAAVPATEARKLVELETERFRQRRQTYVSESEMLSAVAAEAAAHLDALSAQAREESFAARADEDQVGKVRAIVDGGLAPKTRLYDTLRDSSNSKSRYLATESQTSLAKRALGEAQAQLRRYQQERRTSLLQEAEDVAVALHKLDAQIAASTQKFALVAGARPTLAAEASNDVRVTLFRRVQRGVERTPASEDAEVLAGDTIEVELRPRGLLEAGEPPALNAAP